MSSQTPLPGARDKILFTPGPLTTSRTVKQAMLRDLGSRDAEFIETVAAVRRGLLALGGVADAGYEAVLMQGSGTFGVEAVLSSCIPPGGKLLVVVNGAYGRRMVQMAQVLGIDCRAATFAEDQWPETAAVEAALDAEPGFTHLAIVHSETTSGLLNPVGPVGRLARSRGLVYIVDAMSSFGAVELDLAASGIDYLVSSANKCIEGVPGFSFVLARRAALLATAGWARSLSLDLLAQWRGLEADGQFRFTPPTQAILAFNQALSELEAEGGVAGRAARYRANHELLVAGMRDLGFREYVPPERRGYVITTFLYPDHPRFDFPAFYARLSAKGQVIYPGKLTQVDGFRIGTIGRLFPADVAALLAAVRQSLTEMGIAVPLTR
jgi:2-aminoethylphosphonate-pyruvate transaminase